MPQLMTAAVFGGPGQVEVVERTLPAPGPGELLVRVRAAGVCGTDLHAYEAGHQLMRPGTVLGHEFAGIVVECGHGTRTAEGTRIACGATLACGTCPACRRGRSNLCAHYGALGLSADGGLAQYCIAPESICLDLDPYGLGFDTAAIAQPASVATHAVKRGLPDEHEDIAVFGAGGIGALVVTVLQTLNRGPTVFEPSPERRQLVGQLAPSARAADSSAELEPESFDLVYEASGTPAGLAEAQRSLRRGGRLVLIGLQSAQSTVDTQLWTLREFDVVGSQAHRVESDLADALAMLARAGSAVWDAYAPRVLPLADLVDRGLRPGAAARASGGKMLFDPWAPIARAAQHVLVER